jgi:hypothetical protein
LKIEDCLRKALKIVKIIKIYKNHINVKQIKKPSEEPLNSPGGLVITRPQAASA